MTFEEEWDVVGILLVSFFSFFIAFVIDESNWNNKPFWRTVVGMIGGAIIGIVLYRMMME